MTPEHTPQSLQQQYLNNLDVFRQYYPALYDPLTADQTQEYQLEIDDVGRPNIRAQGNYLYPGNAVSCALAQVKQYVNGPARLRVNPQYYERKDKMIFYNHLSNLSDRSPVFEEGKQVANDYHFDQKNLPGIVVFGVGLGYHLRLLIEKFNIQQLIVVDVDFQLLKVSLHVMDWRPIFEYFSVNDREFRINIDANGEKLGHSILEMMSAGHHVLWSNSFLYKHYNHPVLDEAYEFLRSKAYLILTGWGFYDDERESTIQALCNHGKRVPLYTGMSGFKNEKTAIIVANGPSLDKAIEFLKNNHKKAIIFSCGSAISSLKKLGIKPDIHIEMERPYFVYAVLESTVGLDYMKDIPIMAPSRTHPDVFEMTRFPLQYDKNYDAGGTISNYPLMNLTNPTVANAAVSLSVTLGFKTLYMLGMDFGYPQDTHYHSKHSFYSDPENELHNFRYQATMTLPDVHGNLIDTTQVLAKSCEAVAAVLGLRPDVDVYNLALGADIPRTQWIDPDDAAINASDLNKSESMKCIYEQFNVDYASSIEPQSVLDNIQSTLKACMADFESLACESEMDGIDDFIHLCMKIHLYLKRQLRPKSATVEMLLRGTLWHIQHIGLTHHSAIKESKERIIFLKATVTEMKLFIQSVADDMPKNATELNGLIRRDRTTWL